MYLIVITTKFDIGSNHAVRALFPSRSPNVRRINNSA